MTFPAKFLRNPRNLEHLNRCLVRGFRHSHDMLQRAMPNRKFARRHRLMHAAPATKCATHLVRKCKSAACQSYKTMCASRKPPKGDTCCCNRQRHGHRASTANGCGRKSNLERTRLHSRTSAKLNENPSLRMWGKTFYDGPFMSVLPFVYGSGPVSAKEWPAKKGQKAI